MVEYSPRIYLHSPTYSHHLFLILTIFFFIYLLLCFCFLLFSHSDKKGSFWTSRNGCLQSVQVWIFEAGSVLTLGPNENSSFHGNVCVSFNGSGTFETLSLNQLLVYRVNYVTRWPLVMFDGHSLEKHKSVLCQLVQ